MPLITVTIDEVAGLTDGAGGVVRAITGTINETAGTTDASGGLTIGRQITLDENPGLTDAGVVAAATETIQENAGLVDSRQMSGGSGGQLTVVISENAGLADPFYLSGGSAAAVAPEPKLPTLVVEVGFDAAPDVTAAFTLDDPLLGLLDGTAPLAESVAWSNISPYVRAAPMRVTRGVEQPNSPVLRYTAGTLQVTLNNKDRRFDPLNLSGPYVLLGASQVEPMRPVRVRATWRGQEYWLFTGYVDTWEGSYLAPQYAETVLTATDGFKVLAAYDRAEQATAVGQGELSGVRVTRLLDAAGWPAEKRVIDAGTATLTGTKLAGTALAELQLVAETESGDLLIDPEGNVTFLQAYSVALSPRGAESQATFGDDPTGSELRYADVTLAYDDESLVNIAQISREGGAVQTARNDASVQRYLPHAYARTDMLFSTDTAAAALAGDVVDAFGTPRVRFTQLVLRPQRDPIRLFPQCLGRRIGDRITIIRRPPGGGSAIQQDVTVRGIDHQMDGETWTTTFTLSATYRDDVFVLDSPTLGLLDTSRIT
jgi:hypothetical protein